MELMIGLLVAVAVVVLVAMARSVRRETVFEFERALRYSRGRFRDVLAPGVYWHVPRFTTLVKVDVRPRFMAITGQEVLSADGVSLKLSMAANFRVADPRKAINEVQSFDQALHVELQLALREVIGSADIDSVMQSRDLLSKKLHETTAPKAAALGLELTDVNLKDLMFPGKLKQVFAQVVNARKEGLAALERARGETAALRSLANAARMLDRNPSLMRLRMIQSVGESSGNTLILGMPADATPVPVGRPPETHGSELPSDDSDES